MGGCDAQPLGLRTQLRVQHAVGTHVPGRGSIVGSQHLLHIRCDCWLLRARENAPSLDPSCTAKVVLVWRTQSSLATAKQASARFPARG